MIKAVKYPVGVIVGTALFYFMASTFSFPVFSRTEFAPQYAFLAFAACLLGPVPGFLIGFLGHMLRDFFEGYGIWWSWVICSGLVGFCSGFLADRTKLMDGILEKSEVIRFVAGNLVIHMMAWVLLAPILDILLYSRPASEVFKQGLTAASIDFSLASLCGGVLLYGMTKCVNYIRSFRGR
ncbi:MAG: ECF-type riboflavin transporter substrate-binding protein [Clostridiales bacterium]|jgi:energy-coupling factor transport system substrate-specific component|nr:ECF-type riboflavin transporter substrate-binding protein [Clostridiales bacterium]